MRSAQPPASLVLSSFDQQRLLLKNRVSRCDQSSQQQQSVRGCARVRAGNGAANRRALSGASHVRASNEENDSGISSAGHCSSSFEASAAVDKLNEKLARSLLVLLFIISIPSV
jgi:hypothetical protein